VGLQVVQELWTHDINSELAVDATSFEQLMAHYREGSHTWVVLVKADSKERGVKVKSLIKKEEFDIRYSDLAIWLRTELRTRSHRDIWPEHPKLFRNASQTDGGSSSERVNDVRILVAQHRNKKTNRRNIIDSGKFCVKNTSKLLLLSNVLSFLSSSSTLPGTRRKGRQWPHCCH
jgi:translation initiation factor 2-alpha kinase 4